MFRRPFLPLLVLPFLFPTSAALGDGCARCECDAKGLLKKSYDELLCLYKSLEAAEIPKGFYRGTVIARSPKLTRRACADVTRLVWQGKWICPDEGLMVNEVMGKPRVTAGMALGESWVDDGGAMIFDYACSSAKFARDARDEVRRICPGLYLGIMWIREECDGPRLSTFFLLEETCGCQ